MKFLIIDDEDTIIEMLCDMINEISQDAFIRIASDKASAYRIASSEVFDVIISDQNMTDFCGLEFLLSQENTGAKLYLFSADEVDLKKSSIIKIDKLSITNFMSLMKREFKNE